MIFVQILSIENLFLLFVNEKSDYKDDKKDSHIIKHK